MAVFQTPPNQRSFSGLIDDAVLATGKPGSLTAIIQQAILTIRECQGLALFARDMVETDTFTVTATPVIWNRPPLLRKIRTVEYMGSDYVSSIGSDCGRRRRFPKFLQPGRIQKNEWEYFYAADDYFVFNGVQLNEIVAMANYYWSKSLTYMVPPGTNQVSYPGGPYGTRLAYFDLITDLWMYLQADGVTYGTTTGNVDTDTAYRAASGNWLVMDWYPLILSGIKAKIFGSTGDPRATVEYSLYKQVQSELRISSGQEAEGF